MIVFDCEHLNCPDAGMSGLCRGLASALARHPVGLQDRLCLYVPSGYMGFAGNDASYMAAGLLSRFRMRIRGDVKVWHSVFHRDACFPPHGAAYVLTVPGLEFLYDKPVNAQPAYLAALQKHIDRADVLVAVSEYAKRELMDHADVRGKTVEVSILQPGMSFEESARFYAGIYDRLLSL